EPGFCQYPCQCPNEEFMCENGVQLVKDGCSCCMMCPRQLGDLCSKKDKCDVTKGLYCDNKNENTTGICRGKSRDGVLVERESRLLIWGEKLINWKMAMKFRLYSPHGLVGSITVLPAFDPQVFLSFFLIVLSSCLKHIHSPLLGAVMGSYFPSGESIPLSFSELLRALGESNPHSLSELLRASPRELFAMHNFSLPCITSLCHA
ncbi:CCN family member 2, partial [Biomphalaria glabrata]